MAITRTRRASARKGLLVAVSIVAVSLIGVAQVSAQVSNGEPVSPPEPASAMIGGSETPALGASTASTPNAAETAAIRAKHATGRGWTIEPSIAVESTLTSNEGLDPSNKRRSDWVNQFTPGVRFNAASAHTTLTGDVSVPLLVYTRTSSRNYAAPEANVNGTLEAIDRLLFVDASANVSQQYFNPFGPQSVSLANATQNRYTSRVYTVSPYLKGTVPGDLDYELRQRSTWSDASGLSGVAVSNRSYTDDVEMHLSRKPAPAGWNLDYAHSDIYFSDEPGQNRETTEIAHASAKYQIDPAFQLAATGGYESNQFFAGSDSGPVYGVGAEWHPTDRASLKASAEHRFFGTGYSLSIDNHTHLTILSIKASRDITSYPQQVAALPAGVSVAGLLDTLYASQIPNPAQRQALVDQVIADRGLPQILNNPIALFAQQITLVESQTGTFGILGARNTILVTAYRARNQPIFGAEDNALSPLLAQFLNNTQVGTNVIYTHQLAPLLTFGINGAWSRVTDNSTVGGTTRLYSLQPILSRVLTPLTSIYAGARYQDANSNVAAGYREFAVFVGLTHTFR